MNRDRAVHVVVPADLDDPRRPSGGNTYDRRLCEGLAAAGWSVRTWEVADSWAWAGRKSRRALAAALGAALERVPDTSVVLVDGLLASASPEALVPAGRRLRTVVLMHLPLGAQGDDADRDREASTVRASAAVVATSNWTRRWLVGAYGLDPGLVRVAHPGVDPAAAATVSPDGRNILSVGAVTPGKGHDLLVGALARNADLPWRCVCVGPLSRSPDFVAALHDDICDAGLDDRLHLVGPRTGEDLDAAYAAADILVLASRVETYGMVVTEALAHGVPVLACDVGGVSEALGRDAVGHTPGLLVPGGDGPALARAVRDWLCDAALRRRLRASATERRRMLTGWDDTAQRVARVLEEVAV